MKSKNINSNANLRPALETEPSAIKEETVSCELGH
jgi:hypothetical protein